MVVGLCGGVARGVLCCVFLDGVGGSDGISITSSDELSTSTISSNLDGTGLAPAWLARFASGDEARSVPPEDEVGTAFAVGVGVNRACVGSGGFAPEELTDCAVVELVV